MMKPVASIHFVGRFLQHLRRHTPDTPLSHKRAHLSSTPLHACSISASPPMTGSVCHACNERLLLHLHKQPQHLSLLPPQSFTIINSPKLSILPFFSLYLRTSSTCSSFRKGNTLQVLPSLRCSHPSGSHTSQTTAPSVPHPLLLLITLLHHQPQNPPMPSSFPPVPSDRKHSRCHMYRAI